MRRLLLIACTGCLASNRDPAESAADGKADGPPASWVAGVKTALADEQLVFDELTDVEELPRGARLAYEEHVLVHGFDEPLYTLTFEHDGEPGYALDEPTEGGHDVDLFDDGGVQIARANVGNDGDVSFRTFQRIDLAWVKRLADAFADEPVLDDAGDVRVSSVSRTALPATPRAYFDHERDAFGVDHTHAYELVFSGRSGFVVVGSAEHGSADGFVKLFTGSGRLAAAGIGESGRFRYEY